MRTWGRERFRSWPRHRTGNGITGCGFRCNALCSVPFTSLSYSRCHRTAGALFSCSWLPVDITKCTWITIFSLFIQCKLEYQACILGKQISVKCEGRCPCPSDTTMGSSRNMKRGRWWKFIYTFTFVPSIKISCSEC